MKKSILTMALFLGFGMVSCSQGTPSAVKTAFNEKFPNATSVKWEKENETEWEAEFKLNDVEYSANFSNDGIWKETEHEVVIGELPDVIKNVLENQYDGYTIKGAEIIETPTLSGFEVEIKKGKETLEIMINADGIVQKNVGNEQED